MKVFKNPSRICTSIKKLKLCNTDVGLFITEKLALPYKLDWLLCFIIRDLNHYQYTGELQNKKLTTILVYFSLFHQESIMSSVYNLSKILLKLYKINNWFILNYLMFVYFVLYVT